jgi:glycosyltransferase involved in cell wall biosynthesis
MKVSCILPTYNRPLFAVDRIFDMFNQSHKDWELIIINDGSTKDYSLFKMYLEKDPRIKMINLEANSGSVSIPRNIGITHATGDYICHIDDDVHQYPNKLHDLCRLLDNYNTDLVFGQRFELRNKKLHSVPKMSVWEPNTPYGWGVDNGQIMYRRSVYDKIDLVFARRGCDWELAKKIREYSRAFVSTPAVVCCYVWHLENRSLNEATKTTEIYPAKFKHYFKWGTIPEIV